MWLLYREVSTAVIDVVSQWPSVVFTWPASPSVFPLRSQIKSVTWSTSLEPRGACGSQYPVIPLRSGSPGAEIVGLQLVRVVRRSRGPHRAGGRATGGCSTECPRWPERHRVDGSPRV